MKFVLYTTKHREPTINGLGGLSSELCGGCLRVTSSGIICFCFMVTVLVARLEKGKLKYSVVPKLEWWGNWEVG